MSADNILVIVEHEQRIRLIDINFSGASSHEDWFPDEPTPESVSRMSAHVVKYGYEIWKSDPCPQERQKSWRTRAMARANGQAKKYEKTNFVEYGCTELI